MLNFITPNKRGFTIIEVVIVLAIAGLIFAVVFIAVPQLQAAQRDQARKNEIGRLEAAVTQYQSTHNGDVPNWSQVRSDVIPNYLDNDFADPIGGDYDVRRRGWAWISYEQGRIGYIKGVYRCSSNSNVTRSGAGSRSYVVLYELEQGGRQCSGSR